MSDDSRLLVAISTTETREDADRLAGELLERGLTACVQIDGPIRSHYRWAGKTQCESEYRLMIKSRMGVWGELKAKLAELHPYDEPEIVMMPVEDASAGYRDWVVDQTS